MKSRKKRKTSPAPKNKPAPPAGKTLSVALEQKAQVSPNKRKKSPIKPSPNQSKVERVKITKKKGAAAPGPEIKRGKSNKRTKQQSAEPSALRRKTNPAPASKRLKKQPTAKAAKSVRLKQVGDPQEKSTSAPRSAIPRSKIKLKKTTSRAAVKPGIQSPPKRRKRQSKPKQEIQASTNFVIHFWDPSRMDRCVGFFVREITQGARKGDIVVQRIGNRKPRTLTLPLKCVIRIDQRIAASSQ